MANIDIIFVTQHDLSNKLVTKQRYLLAKARKTNEAKERTLIKHKMLLISYLYSIFYLLSFSFSIADNY